MHNPGYDPDRNIETNVQSDDSQQEAVDFVDPCPLEERIEPRD